jgi:hypothetical protein
MNPIKPQVFKRTVKANLSREKLYNLLIEHYSIVRKIVCSQPSSTNIKEKVAN